MALWLGLDTDKTINKSSSWLRCAVNFLGKGRERRAPIQRQQDWLEVREGTVSASRWWHRGDPAVIPLPVCKKTSVCGRGEKKSRAAAAAGVTVPPEKVGQAMLQSPARAPAQRDTHLSPDPPSALCSQPGTASPAPKAAAVGLCWHQPLTPMFGRLFGPAVVALGEGGSVGSVQEERQSWREDRAGGRGCRAAFLLPASLSCSPVSGEDLVAGGM